MNYWQSKFFVITFVGVLLNAVHGWVLYIIYKLKLFVLTKHCLQRSFEITLMKTLARSDTDYIDVNVTLSNDTGLNSYILLKRKLEIIYLQIGFHAESRKGHYDLEVVNKTVNMCQFLKNMDDEPLLKVIYSIILNHSNLPRQCPFEKVRVYICCLFYLL